MALRNFKQAHQQQTQVVWSVDERIERACFSSTLNELVYRRLQMLSVLVSIACRFWPMQLRFNLAVFIAAQAANLFALRPKRNYQFQLTEVVTIRSRYIVLLTVSEVISLYIVK